MAGQQHKTKKDLKRESRELELTERRIYLSLAVFLTLTTAVNSFLGTHWTVPAALVSGPD
jgi:hypothetical protein